MKSCGAQFCQNNADQGFRSVNYGSRPETWKNHGLFFPCLLKQHQDGWNIFRFIQVIDGQFPIY
jgi:hypothetical protein